MQPRLDLDKYGKAAVEKGKITQEQLNKLYRRVSDTARPHSVPSALAVCVDWLPYRCSHLDLFATNSKARTTSKSLWARCPVDEGRRLITCTYTYNDRLSAIENLPYFFAAVVSASL